MEIICAGVNKTATKSCTLALRELGINVADYGETIFYLTEIWTQYLEGKVPIKEVIDEYTKLGFQANQDFPGNVYWEELFNASPNAKVILTVRDNADIWNKSFLSFLRQEYHLKWSFWLNQRMFTARWFGEKIGKMFDITNHCFRKGIMRTANWSRDGPFIPAPLHAFSPSKHLDNFESAIIEGKSYYHEHNERVKNIVPKDRLLVWNVKDGWEPLCTFLGKDIPDKPIPHVNKTAKGENFMAEFVWKDEFKREVESAMLTNLGIFTAKVILFSTAVGATVWYCKSRK